MSRIFNNSNNDNNNNNNNNDLVQQTLDEQDLVAHFRTAQDGQPRLGRRVEHLAEGLELARHEEAGGPHLEALAQHRRVRAVRRPKRVVDIHVCEAA